MYDEHFKEEKIVAEAWEAGCEDGYASFEFEREIPSMFRRSEHDRHAIATRFLGDMPREPMSNPLTREWFAMRDPVLGAYDDGLHEGVCIRQGKC